MNPKTCDILEESVAIPFGRDQLTGVLAYPFAGEPRGAALVIGPHPLMGGRLENNVVRHVGRGLAEHGLLSLRFCFANAGVSADVMESFWETGQAPDDVNRGQEAQAALDWLARTCTYHLLLVGYSFGASLLGELASTGNVAERITAVALIGPTLAQHDYTLLAASPLPKLVITADNDFATPLTLTRKWFAGTANPKRLVVVPAAEHFYRDQEPRLIEEIVSWMPC
jgi:alpha/beta superfamily hydrolase